MSAERRHASESYLRAVHESRRLRGVVAEQMHGLISEADIAGSRSEMAARVAQIVAIERKMEECKGRYHQAVEHGLPTAPSVRDHAEQKHLLREAVMRLGAACGTWAASMDFERLREQDPSLDGSDMTKREDEV